MTIDSKPVFLYGYGSKKHIPKDGGELDRWGDLPGLCGSYGRPEPQRRPTIDAPLCKRCEKAARAAS